MGRAKPGKARIERSMLELLKHTALADIKVVDLCKLANVSRSTFYAHFSNVYEVYRSLVGALAASTSALRPQLRCSDCKGDAARTPLCVMIREADEYRGLVNDERFFDTLLDAYQSGFQEDPMSIYRDLCGSDEVAHALYCFQMMGCITTARAVPASADWAPVKQVIDAFIRGGINAVRDLQAR